jgi:hypothetical protein
MELVQHMFPDYDYEAATVNPESPGFVHRKVKTRMIRFN